jgi:hypothetical protein
MSPIRLQSTPESEQRVSVSGAIGERPTFQRIRRFLQAVTSARPEQVALVMPIAAESVSATNAAGAPA